MSLTSSSLDANAEKNLGSLAQRMQITVAGVDAEGYLRLQMPVAGNEQPYGLLHGGANAVLIETAASLAAAGDYPAAVALGASLSVQHVAPVKTGTVETCTRACYRGERRAIYEVVVTSRELTVALGQLTCAVKPRA